MRYKDFIETYFLIDEPQTGRLVPFVFNEVQKKYYAELKELGIEKLGLAAPIREFIVKARREGFSSMILAIFAADDILQTNPTESMVISYRDDATTTFRRRYRRYVLSYFSRKSGITVEQIQDNTNILEQVSKQVFSIDASDVELRHNRAHFYCGTAAARTGGRGGVLQKLLFTEPAHYQDTEKITSKEIIEGTAQQVDKNSGWIFQESTANGKGNFHYQTYESIVQGLSRYKLRFYGWREFYTEKQFEVIKSEFTDPDMLQQEYPETVEEAFLSSNLSFTNKNELLGLIKAPADKVLKAHLELQGVNYIDQCEMMRDFLLTLERANPNKNLYAGIDSAKDKDRTVVTVLIEKDPVANAGIRGLGIDATGAGDFIPDWFERNTKWYVHRVKFSRPQKSLLYKNLRVVIQDKLTELPEFIVDNKFISEEWERFFKEMVDLQKEVVGELLVVAHPEGEHKHDDYPDSWALAELVYMVLRGVPKSRRAPEESTSTANSVRKLLNVDKSTIGQGMGGEDFV